MDNKDKTNPDNSDELQEMKEELENLKSSKPFGNCSPELIKKLRDTATTKVSALEKFLEDTDEPTDDVKQPTPKEMAKFNGHEVVKAEIQKDLDQMKTAPRVEALTSNRRIELLKQLESCQKKGELEDGLALYKEHQEMINPDYEDTEDYDEAYWLKTEYIEKLYQQRKASSFWESL